MTAWASASRGSSGSGASITVADHPGRNTKPAVET
jgi:hypothetical protein